MLRIDVRLQEVFRAKLGLVLIIIMIISVQTNKVRSILILLVLFKEGHCHGGMTIQYIQFAVIL